MYDLLPTPTNCALFCFGLVLIILFLVSILATRQNKMLRRKIVQTTKAQMRDLEKFQLAVDGAYDHIIITDADAKIIYANRAVKNITGYDPAEIINKNPGDLWGGNMEKKFYKEMWRILKKERKNYIGEVKNKRKNGESYLAEVRISPILDELGKVEFLVGIERDITKAKEADRAKSEFISVASHQLRAPLTGIKWFTELLLEQKLKPEIKDFVEQISLSNEKMVHLVEDLLNVSRIETGRKFEIVPVKNDVVAIVKQVISAQSILANSRQIKIEWNKKCPRKLILEVDGEKMRQVFQNLISNAFKYSMTGGAVDVGCKASAEGKEWVFYVKDGGIGIPKDQQHRIFEKFFRAENALVHHTDGTGLGLFIVKSIVEGHGGKVWFESAEDKGTVFYFTLPIKTKR